MAVYRFAGSLNAAQWPLIAALQGRTVIQPLYDWANRMPRYFFGTEESAELNVPQIIYCENVVPAAEGLNSVGYLDLIAASGNTDFDQIIILRDATENNFLFAPANGKNYILDPSTKTWASKNAIIGLSHPQVSRAYVNGRTFVCYAGTNIYEYIQGADTFLPVALTLPAGVALSDIKGIGSSSNYLIFYTDITVYWSSLIDPTDFVASLITGAGNATPQDVKGQITAINGTSGGFVIWTIRNAVAAQYTNNVRAPFAFKEIAGAGGITDNEHVTNEASSGPQYAWTSAGLQKITLQGSEEVSGEINDFLAGRVYNTWNAATKTLDLHASGLDEFYIKIVLVSSRFLCISYCEAITANVPQFTYCLMYDTVLKRWGQFKVDHVDVFSITVGTTGGGLTFTDLGTQTFTALGTATFSDLVASGVGVFNPTSKRQIAFLQANGAVKIALMDYNKAFNHTGVVILGKFQLVRAQLLTHQLTTVEGAYGFAVSGQDTFQAYITNSYDGLNMQAAIPLPVITTGGLSISYGMRLTGINYNLTFTGTFALSSFVSEVCNDGSD